MNDDIRGQQLEEAKELLKEAQMWINKGIEKEAFKNCALPKAPRILSDNIIEFLEG